MIANLINVILKSLKSCVELKQLMAYGLKFNFHKFLSLNEDPWMKTKWSVYIRENTSKL